MSQDAISFDDVSVHFLDDEALLFDRQRQRIYGANASAAFIWSCLEDGLTPDQTIDLLVSEHGLDPVLARQSVDQTITHWKTRPESDDGIGPADAMPAAKRIDAAGASDNSDDQALLTSIFRVRHYRLLDSAISIRFETAALLRMVDEVFAHLAIDARAERERVFDLLVYDGGFAVLENGLILEWCESLAGVAVMVKICIIRHALESSADFCALHAGLVRKGEKCILLPGVSGAGKSTLVAGLAGAGYEIWGDDTAVLAADTLLARPVPCGIGLKPGSWPIAASAGFPRIAQAPVHVRPDGKRVRYLLPPDYAVAELDATAPVGWIVFPQYDAEARTELTELSKTDALRRLFPGFVPLGDTLEATDIARLVRWIGDVACFDLHLSSLDEAIKLLDRDLT